MAAARALATICTTDQWLRCSHTGTALDLGRGEVSLAWSAPAGASWSGSGLAEPAGLAFDPAGCLYHGDLPSGQVQWIPWQPPSALSLQSPPATPVDLLSARASDAYGEFASTPASPSGIVPSGLALDLDQHLFVLDGATGTIWLFDLASRTTFRHVALSSAITGLAGSGSEVLVAVADRATPLYSLAARRDPTAVAVRAEALAGVDPAALPAAVCCDADGRIWMLWRNAAGASWAVPVSDERTSAALGPFDLASGIALDGSGTVVVAGPAGDDFLSFAPRDAVVSDNPPLLGRNYDGRGIVTTPEGRIGYWTGRGLRIAVADRLSYARSGTLDCFELDGGNYQRRWGRVFVDACIPDGTSIRIASVTSDDEPGMWQPSGDSIGRSLPANLDAAGSAAVPLALPPLVATDLAPSLAATTPLVYREVGREVPWLSRPADDPFETYEGVVQAGPGRYLWLRLELEGNTALTPTVRAVRVEYPGTDWPQRLPAIYSADATAADFLFRWLSLPDGIVADLDARAAARDLLLDAFGAPVEALAWIASLFGLALDERWSEASRRQLLAEVIWLWRRRGTLGALARLLEIYLGVEPVIVESWRLRAVGGTAGGSVVGGSVLGGSVVGGGLLQDPFTTYAHRFSVILPLLLDAEQQSCVTDLLDTYKPAHTLYELCTVGAGMRVGLGLHAGLTSLVGPSSGWRELQVGASALGTDAVVGRPEQGFRPGGSRVGIDSRTDT